MRIAWSLTSRLTFDRINKLAYFNIGWGVKGDAWHKSLGNMPGGEKFLRKIFSHEKLQDGKEGFKFSGFDSLRRVAHPLFRVWLINKWKK